MEVINKQDQRGKAFAIKSIMKNKNLSQALLDSWNSPIGSTKRQKAKSILKSISKANDNYGNVLDGQGGGSPFAYNGGNPFVEQQGFTQIPPEMPPIDATGNLSPGNPIQPSQQGEGEADVFTNPNKTIFIPSVDDLQPSSMPFDQKPQIDPETGQLDTGILSRISGLSGGTSQSGTASTPNTMGITNTAGTIGPQNQMGPRSPYIYTPSGDMYWDAFREINQNKDWSKYVPVDVSAIKAEDRASFITDNYKDVQGPSGSNTLYGLPKDPATLNAGDEVVIDGTTGEAGYAAGLPMGMDYLEGLITGGHLATADDWYSSLGSSSQEYYKDVYDAVKMGKSPQAYMDEIMGNKKELSALLGVPETDLNKILPAPSAWLGDQLYRLKENITKEYQLDSQRDRLISLITQGGTADVDFKAYIRGRDQYTGEIDAMIDKAKDKTAYMDTSDPYVARKMQNWNGYLTVLKGRQTMLYQDFMDTAISYHNTKIDHQNMLYNSLFTEAENKYNSQSALAQEAYTRASSKITDMFNAVSTGVQNMRDADQYEVDKAKDALDMYKSVADIYKIYNNIDADTISAEHEQALDWANLQFDYAKLESDDEADALKAAKYDADDLLEYFGMTVDKDSGAVTGMDMLNPVDVIKYARANNIPEDKLFESWKTKLKKYIGGQTSYSAMNDVVNEELGYLDDLSASLAQATDPEEIAAISAVIAETKEAVQRSVKAAMSSKLNGLEDMSGVKSMIEDLAGVGWFDKKEKPNEKDQRTFLGRHSHMDDLAPLMWDWATYTSVHPQYGTGGDMREIFKLENGNYMYDLPDDEIKLKLLNALPTYIVNKVNLYE